MTTNKFIASLLLCYHALAQEQQNLVNERDLLATVFEATSGSTKWKNATNWNTQASICEWNGITCGPESVQGRVVAIELPENGLTGSIPSELYQMPVLEKLVLNGNPLTDAGFLALAANVSSSPLTHVDLSSCFLTSIAGIEHASSLKELLLDRNQLLTSEFPPQLWELTQLQKLSIDHNRLGLGKLQLHLPTEIGLLTHLRELSARENDLNGSLPAEIGRLVQLRILGLSFNEFTGTLPTDLEQLVNLEVLNLRGKNNGLEHKLTGPLLSFHSAPRLARVVLDHQSLTGTIPSNFLDASAVSNRGSSDLAVTVHLEANQLTGTLPESLGRFDALNIYLVENNRFVGPLPKSWCNDSNLKGRWMNGLVALYGCDAILCAPSTYNPSGKQTDAHDPCSQCQTGQDESKELPSVLLGSTQCGRNTSTGSLAEETARILAVMYQALDGRDGWHNNEGWNVFDDLHADLDSVQWSGVTYCNNFHGVLCSPDGHVRFLTLSNNGLSGRLPSRVFAIPGLESLDVSFNRVQVDPVGGFDGLQAASRLIRLKMSNCDVSTLKNIGQGTVLTELYLDGSDLEGSLPRELFQLTNLKVLHLEASYLHGTIPQEIRELYQLTKLTLRENRFEGSIPSEIAQLTRLQHVDLSDNDFQGSLPPEINNMRNLLSLRINRARGGLGGKLLSFNGMDQIEELELVVNSFSGTIPTNFLSGRKSVQPLVVRMAGNKLEGVIPSNLAAISNLTIELEDNNITDIPLELCAKGDWMEGEVGKASNGCDAILCPKGTWSPHGREVPRLNVTCTQCPGNRYYGETACESAGLQYNREVQILDEFFVATGGRYWNASHTNWTKPGIPLCYREGVVCGWPTPDMNWGVTELRLNAFGLRGQIPAEIYELPRLRALILSDNEVDLSFDGIGQAEILEILRVSRTKISSLAGILNAGGRLFEIGAEQNQLSGEFPTELLQRRTLQRLYLDDNHFFGTIPPEIGSLTDMTKLRIGGNDFAGPLPTQIGSLTNLEVLDVHDNKLSGVLPTELGRLVNLTRALLYGQRGTTRFTGPVFSFSSNPSLRELYLSRNNFQGKIPSNLLASTDKEASINVDLSYNQLTGSLPVELERFEKLNIDVVSNQIDDLPAGLCNKPGWMLGMVGNVSETERCNAILCPPGTAVRFGRQIDVKSKCHPCPSNDQAPFYGSLSCLNRLAQIERAVLIQFFKGAGGKKWLNSANWISERHVCSWFGVSCDQAYSVVGIKLENNRLTNGDADMDILLVLSHLPHLKELDLKGNSLALDLRRVSSDWPLERLLLSATGLASLEGIGRLKSLKSLHAADNTMTGMLPEDLYQITGLEHVYLSFNKLSGTISSDVSALSSLQELYLFDNDITGTIPEELGRLSSLRELVLAENRLNGTLPFSITRLPSLEQLQLQAQKGADLIEGQLPLFDQAVNLWYLDLSDNALSGKLTDSFLEGSLQVNKSVSILLRNNKLTGAIPGTLNRFQNMYIELAGNGIESLPKELCSMKAWMNGAVGMLKNCDSILCPVGTFAPSGRQVTRSDPCKPCEGLLSSRALGHTYCKEIDSERDVLELFFVTCGGSNWKSHALWGESEPICSWEGIECDGDKDDDDGVSAINLEAFGLTGTIPRQLWSLPRLRVLNLRGNEGLRVQLEGLAASSPLEQLQLHGARTGNLEGISKASNLKHLEFSGSTGFFPEELFSLGKLEELYVSDSQFVGPLPRLSEFANLRRFHASGNDFHGSIPSEIGQLTYLQDLVLDDNLISGELPTELSSMKHLSTLSVGRKAKSGRKLRGPLLAFDMAPGLVSLDLSGNDLTGTIPLSFLSASLGIETVDLSLNHLRGTVPLRLGSLSNLTLLLVDNEISGLDVCNNDEGRCDALLCPPRTANPSGRATHETGSCLPCNGTDLSSVSPFYGSTSCTGPVDEREILMDVFRESGGHLWLRKDFWGTPTDICEWFGVGCIRGKVALLNLQGNNLIGNLNSGIFDLPEIQVLWLGVNPLLSVSFDDVGNAANLLELRLPATTIESLTGLDDAKSLTVLDLKANSLSGSFPTQIFSLNNLRLLDLGENSISGTVPSFEPLVSLRILHLQSNRLVGPLPSFDDSPPTLSDINLSNNALQGTIPVEFLAHVPSSTPVRVDLSGNMLSGAPPPKELGRFVDSKIFLSSGEAFQTSSASSRSSVVELFGGCMALIALGVIL